MTILRASVDAFGILTHDIIGLEDVRQQGCSRLLSSHATANDPSDANDIRILLAYPACSLAAECSPASPMHGEPCRLLGAHHAHVSPHGASQQGCIRGPEAARQLPIPQPTSPWSVLPMSSPAT